ncbi:L10-interacting MYB domain-containing protein [Quillaja saponaria]|uniref:L10-interacting MYB domain-containing protein n=1 Tax=Quillaja saponaria TaxID=32244 RepID=A0AAD7VJ49_QUISA|nr:L10-interacting MYB domain-containing protein [Quillaja saponaria]
MQDHTDARQFMTQPVSYYKDLCIIYDLSGDENESSIGQSLEHQNEELTSSQKLKRQLENWFDSAHSKRSRDEDAGMASALRQMASAVSSLSVKKNDDENSKSIENVTEAVQTLPDMDDDLLLDACDFLEDEMKAKTFMALDVKLRNKWLMRKLRAEV